MAILKRDKIPKDFEKIRVICEFNKEKGITVCYNENGEKEFEIKDNIYESSAPMFIDYGEERYYIKPVEIVREDRNEFDTKLYKKGFNSAIKERDIIVYKKKRKRE